MNLNGSINMGKGNRKLLQRGLRTLTDAVRTIVFLPTFVVGRRPSPLAASKEPAGTKPQSPGRFASSTLKQDYRLTR